MVDPEYSPYDQPLAESLMVCSVCGATVDWAWIYRHTNWHRRIEPKDNVNV
jgi:hypothetical protein